MTNTLLGLAALTLIWFALPALVATLGLACCLLAHLAPRPGRRGARRRQQATTRLADVHQIPAAHPRGIVVARGPKERSPMVA